MWTITEETFKPETLHHKETIFTIGNGYLATRGAFEEGYPADRRATFIHGVFDYAPIVFTELVNAPDWLPLSVFVNGERFSLTTGHIETFEQHLDLRTGVLTRTVRWRSPAGHVATLVFERFASLADEHTLLLRCSVTPEFEGTLEFRAALNGRPENEHGNFWLTHLDTVQQGGFDHTAFLLTQTRTSKIDIALAMRLELTHGDHAASDYWDADSTPTRVLRVAAHADAPVIVDKFVAVYTSRDVPADQLLATTLASVRTIPDWPTALNATSAAWQIEWDRTDVIIEGDDEAQLAIRFNLFQMLIAAPRHDDRVNIGAKTLSGFGYSGHAFWDTEIFMLPLFTYTAPHIAQKLLTYRWRTLPAARRKAQANGFEGAQFAWESADTGDEVTPTWVPHYADKTRLIRIWTGDIEIHISADIAYAAHQYWQATGDDAWFIAQGAELILDTAKFWATRAEWQPDRAGGSYGYSDVIGPDEYHEHVDNNFYTNRLAQWNLQTAFNVLEWLKNRSSDTAQRLIEQLDLSGARLAKWHDVIDKLYLPVASSGLIEQFDGYFQRQDVDLLTLEPRTQSVQEIFGIEGGNGLQAIKQPDVLMLQYLLRSDFSAAAVRVNYDYYAPRTDHTFGSSLGPSIMAIMACDVGEPEHAYEHFMRAARADLRDVRGNASDGIHAASAAGIWQSIVFGFAGLRFTADGWRTQPQLPQHWTRLAFKFFWRGQPVVIELGAA
ncbi:MAG: glycoside hydrolase family 65 protein [Thermoflexales bacterium]|nr:glycoside hydrolase family 65 protein [Thermoflexales bacterium]